MMPIAIKVRLDISFIQNDDLACNGDHGNREHHFNMR